jgi:rhodanese-related sulfurtransferase
VRNIRSLLAEAVLVAVAGLLFALAANAVSPRGLRLHGDYFPHASPAPAPVIGTNAIPAVASSVADAAAARLASQGLQLIRGSQVAELLSDPRYHNGKVVFVDARNDANYANGHIPGAWQFDHYHADRHLPNVLPVCLNAEQVVVYCTGGDCEDSEFAAIILRDSGVPQERLFVFVGGITEWMANGSPVETGVRGSGTITPGR